MDKNSSKKSLETKKLNNKCFKLPIEESIKIIDEVRKIQKHSKVIKPDEYRKQYQELLQWVLGKLQASKQSILSKKSLFGEQSIEVQKIEGETLEEEIQIQQRTTIQSLMQEMIEMFKRQCKQKSQLMQVCLLYFNQLIDSYTKHYKKEFYQTFKSYNIALTQMEDQYEDKISDFNRKISALEGEKQTKWKNIYMLAKDNRVLRRQKGKLLRTAQEQDEKIKLLEEELCQVAKENEMNKLIIRFQNDPKNLQVFLNNRIAILKFEKVLANYSKKAIKVLNNELLKLQIEEQNNLDSKIDCIKRVITQSEDICDQYEDLNEIVSKPNKIVFNMSSQTDPEDILPIIQTKNASVNSDFHYFSKKLKRQYQVFEINIKAVPQIQEIQHPSEADNQVLRSKILTRFSNFKNRQTFRLRFCPQVFNEFVRSRNKKNSDHFDILYSTEVLQTPKFKNKRKSQEKPSKETKMSPIEGYDFIMSQTDLKGVKKQSLSKFSLNRNSEAFTMKKPLFNNINFNSVTESKYDRASYLSFQDYPNQTMKHEDVNDEKSQIPSKNAQQALQKDNNTEDNDIGHEIKFRLKNNKRISRRIQNIPLTFHNDPKSNDSDLQKESQKVLIQKKEKTLQEKGENFNSSGKKEKSNGSNSNDIKGKGNHAIKKMSRVKTSQNLRMKNSPRKWTKMDFIEEQSSELSRNSKSKIKNRYTHNPSSIQQKKLEFHGHQNNVNQFRQSYTNDFVKENKKYRISTNPSDSNERNKPSRLTLRNSSLNHTNEKVENTNNVDITSMHSYVSIQKSQGINPKALTEVKPKQLILLESLQSEFLDPISIKPYEVKKIAEKILRNMYIRRKQLLSTSSSPCLRNFIEHFLKQLYGDKWKGQKNLLRYIFTVHDRESSSDVRVFNLLMNANVHVEYLQDLFRLYLIMIDKHDFSGIENYLICTKNKGISIIKYLLSIYFDESTASEIQQNLPIFNSFEVDLNEIYIVVETQIRKYTVQTEIYHFLSNLMPENQSNIEFSHMKEIMFLFKNQPNYHTHVSRLKYFFKIHGKVLSHQQQNNSNKTQSNKRTKNSKGQKAMLVKKASIKEQFTPQIQILPLHKVCLYLKRYEWTHMLEINTFVEEKYSKIVGNFIHEKAIKYISKYCLKIGENLDKKNTNCQNGIMNISASLQKKQQRDKSFPLTWLLERSKQLIKNYYRYKATLDKYFLMFVHLSILMYELQIAMQDVICEPLNLLTNEFKRIKAKQQMNAFLKD